MAKVHTKRKNTNHLEPKFLTYTHMASAGARANLRGRPGAVFLGRAHNHKSGGNLSAAENIWKI